MLRHARLDMLTRGSKLARKASLKRKTSTGLSRKKKTPEAKLKAQLWELCKQIIRKKYGNTCYTCKKEGLEGSNWHTGHFIARSVCGNYLYFDLRNLRPQCYRCNISLVGNGAVFYSLLRSELGQEYVDGIFADKNRPERLNKSFLEEKIEEYTKILQELEQRP
jgi:hypothetical protein